MECRLGRTRADGGKVARSMPVRQDRGACEPQPKTTPWLSESKRHQSPSCGTLRSSSPSKGVTTIVTNFDLAHYPRAGVLHRGVIFGAVSPGKTSACCTRFAPADFVLAGGQSPSLGEPSSGWEVLVRVLYESSPQAKNNSMK